jgi:glycosyltransferase involved in cell wall biosynthesis
MDIPSEWAIVLNHSKNHYNKEIIDLKDLKNNEKILNLQRDFLSNVDLSLLFYAADAIILPYKVCSASGVMFDALAHGLPFVASDLPFFKEFADQDLGIIVKNRDPKGYSNALETLGRNYLIYKQAVDKFKKNLDWGFVAQEHAKVYMNVVDRQIKIEQTVLSHRTSPVAKLLPNLRS